MFVFCVNNNDKDQDTEYDRSRFAWGAKWRDRQLNKLLK